EGRQDSVRDEVCDEHPAAEVRTVPREHDGMDELLGEPDREEADRYQDDAEQRVDGAEVRALRSRVDREAKHEIRGIEEEEHEEENELVLAPQPPVTPRDLCPDRAGDEDEDAEDDALMDRDVTLEVGVWIALPEVNERLPGAGCEAGICRERDRDAEVEDPLRKPLVEVVGDDEEHEHERSGDERERDSGERRERYPVPPTHRRDCRRSRA